MLNKVNFATDTEFPLRAATFFHHHSIRVVSGTHPTYLKAHNKQPEITIEFKSSQTQPDRIKLLEIGNSWQ